MFEPESSILSTGIKPNIVTGALIQILRSLFSDPKNIVETQLNSFIWNANPSLTAILIEALYKWQPENVQQRPAVLVKRGEWKVTKISIGDKLHGAPEETGYTDMRQVVAMAGSTTMFCLGNSGLEAELLASEVSYHLMEFSAVIRQQLCLGSFQVSDLGEVSRFEEAHDHFAVPVTVVYSFMHNWKLLRQTPEWMRTAFEVQIND